MNVNLSPLFKTYIQNQLDGGKYNNASEVIREALRLKIQQDELYQVKIEALREAIIKGEESGDAGLLDIEDIKQKARERVGIKT